MRRIAWIFICTALSTPVLATAAFGQAPATQPLEEPTTQPALDKLFRSRAKGIQLCPPAGAGIIRELDSGEIVRFVFADSTSDIRVKPVTLHVELPLTAPPDAGLLELTADHLIDTNATAVILRKDVAIIHGEKVGRIEATYNAGTDHIFAQQALFNDYAKTGRHYYSVQMTSTDTAADDRTARAAFEAMLDTVKTLDLEELFKEQQHRLFLTHELYVRLDEKTVSAAIEPLHFMRVVRDGRDIGFMQVNERLAKRGSFAGVEVIIHSHLQVDPRADAPAGANTATPPAEPSGIVIPKAAGPAIKPTTQPTGPHDVYTYSTFFVTFDRDHEDWTTITQTDEDVAHQLTETGYSDRNIHRILDRRKHLATQPTTQPLLTVNASTQPAPPHSDNPVNIIQVPTYQLDTQNSVGSHQEKAKDTDLPPFYLPQALGQLLPRLLPSEPAQYMFASYVSSQRNVMSRYVDVQTPREVELDGQTVRVIPIEDRIGIDGIPTTHYVTRQGEWLASVSDDNRSQVFPTDERTLKGLWPGFVTCPEPPADDSSTLDTIPQPDFEFKVQNSDPGGR